MTLICSFVDKIAAAPATRLNLASGAYMPLVEGRDFSPPTMRRSLDINLMGDGGPVAASAYDNRVIQLPVLIEADTHDALATAINLLHRELDRETNILKWQPHGLTKPVFFRTFRSPDFQTVQNHERGHQLIANLSILAEPFAIGLRETAFSGTISNDPAAGTNRKFIDITGVLGDVLTPIYLYWTVGTTQGSIAVVGIRRHGTPGNLTSFVQAEAMTAMTDTAIQSNSATFSGSGSNYMRTTFATDATLQTRLRTLVPPSTSIDWRGTYRVFARLRSTVTSTPFQIQMKWLGGIDGTEMVFEGDVISLTPSTTTPYMVDLGLITFPPGLDGKYVGYDGDEVAFGAQHYFHLFARRLSGTGSLEWDYIWFVPADEELTLFKAYINVGASDRGVLDGPNDIGLVTTSTGGIQGALEAVPQRSGSIPNLDPRAATNRLFFHRSAGTPPSGPYDDAVGATVAVTAYYWPRYLYVRPA